MTKDMNCNSPLFFYQSEEEERRGRKGEKERKRGSE